MGRKKNVVKAIEEEGRYRVVEAQGHWNVYKRPGVSGQRLKQDTAFREVRRHHAAFKDCVLAGKLLRGALAPLLENVKYGQLTGRMVQLMSRILQTCSLPKEHRRLATGFHSAAGKMLLNGFNFLSGPGLNALLLSPFEVNRKGIYLRNFVAARDLAIPEEATHVELQACCCRVEEKLTAATAVVSAPVRLTLGPRKRKVSLEFAGPVQDEATVLYILKLNFYRKTFRMRGQAVQAMAIVAVEQDRRSGHLDDL